MGDGGDGAASGVELRAGAGFGGERVVVAVVLADSVAIGAVGLGGTEGFDPGVLIGGDGLRGELAADPIGLFRHDDAQAIAAGGEGGGAASGGAADDGDVTADFTAGSPGWDRNGES